MTQIVVMPHGDICPEGAVVEAEVGTSICDALLAHDIAIEHACEMSCACTTCHVIIREGFASMDDADELEEDCRPYFQRLRQLGALLIATHHII